jgi:Fic family protein
MDTRSTRSHASPDRDTLVSDPAEIVRIESRNALLQFDAGMALVDGALAAGTPFRLRPSQLLDLNRLATAGTHRSAGQYRTDEVAITHSRHEPPPAHACAGLVEEMCDYVNDHWSKSAIHLSAYLMWRVNWIHPFADGNGRTSRVIAYVVLCVRLGFRLPGVRTIPEQIAADKKAYYLALEAADDATKAGQLDLSALELLLSELLAKQLLHLHEQATGEAT